MQGLLAEVLCQTQRKGPYLPMCQYFSRRRTSEELTDRTADGNHLQVPAFQLSCQWGFCRILSSAFEIEDLSIGSYLAFLGDVDFRVSLKAFQNPPREFLWHGRLFFVKFGTGKS